MRWMGRRGTVGDKKYLGAIKCNSNTKIITQIACDQLVLWIRNK